MKEMVVSVFPFIYHGYHGYTYPIEKGIKEEQTISSVYEAIHFILWVHTLG